MTSRADFDLGLNMVIEDLKKEKERVQRRLDSLKAAPEPDRGGREIQIAYLNDRLDYVDLLLLRYQSFLSTAP